MTGRLAAVVGFCAVLAAYPLVNHVVQPFVNDPAVWESASRLMNGVADIAGGDVRESELSSLVGSNSPTRTSSPVTGRATLIDGDTISVNGERIRLLDIDAPESYQSRCDKELVLGLKAKERLRALLDSGPLRIDRQGHDRYGRTLARVYAGGRDVGQALLSEGYALRYQPGPAAKEARLKRWCGPGARLPN